MIKLLTESPEFLKTYHDLWWVHSPPLLVLNITHPRLCSSNVLWLLVPYFAPGQLENLSFLIAEVVCQAHWISQEHWAPFKDFCRAQRSLLKFSIMIAKMFISFVQ